MGNNTYGVSKAGLIHLTKWLATALAPNVRVNAISPGGVFRIRSQNLLLVMKPKHPWGAWLLRVIFVAQ